MSPRSLRGRLLRTLMLPIVGGLGLAGFWSFWATYHEANEMYDAAQVHFAHVLYTLARQVNKAETIPVEEVPTPGEYEKYLTFRIFRDGRLLVKSDNAENLGTVSRTKGFVNRTVGDTDWRLYTEHRNGITVEVAENDKMRTDLVHHILLGIFVPQLISVPVVALIIWLGIAGGLLPVERLSLLVRRRSANQLTPLETQGVPRELLPVTDAINDLMQRVGDAMRVEKNFTSYAAHEMRTPIAALKTQAQVILRTRDPERQKELASDLLETVSRTQHIIEQLLTYARVQHEPAESGDIDLSALVMEEIRFAIPRALERSIRLEADVPENMHVVAQPALLRLVLSNLLDNAIKYIPAHGRVEIQLQRTEEGMVLRLADDGPGVTAANLPHIFDPFYRVAGASATGAGLGLAIVRWACEAQGIGVTTHAGIDGKGIGFTLHFRAP